MNGDILLARQVSDPKKYLSRLVNAVQDDHAHARREAEDSDGIQGAEEMKSLKEEAARLPHDVKRARTPQYCILLSSLFTYACFSNTVCLSYTLMNFTLLRK